MILGFTFNKKVLKSVTQSRTKAFQCLPSSHKNNQKFDHFHKGKTRVPKALHHGSNINNTSTNLRDRRKNPVILFVPFLGESVYSFRVRLLKPLIITLNLGVIATGKPIYCVGSPIIIRHVEHIVMYGVIIDGSSQKISLIIKTPRNPLYFKRNTMTDTNITNRKR